MTTVAVRSRRRPAPFPVAVVLVGLLAVAGAAALRSGGTDAFPVDPWAAVALAVGAVVAALARERLRDGGDPRAARHAGLLAGSLLLYLLAGGWAVVAWPGGGPVATVVVAVWNVAWIPPLVLVQLCASAAVRAGTTRPRTHVVVPALLGTTVLASLLLARPSAPFAGLPTVAPEAWRVALAPVDAVATLLGGVGLLVLPVVLWRAAWASRGPVGARLGVAAAGATTAPLTVAFCVLLAVARAPGQVEPELGSVAFLVALAGTTGLGAWCAVLAARDAVGARHVAVVVRGTGLAAAVLVVLAAGTLAVAPGTGLGATAAATVVAATTVVVVGLAWAGTGLLTRALTIAPAPSPEPPPPAAPDVDEPAPLPSSTTLSALTPRETEVLGLLAEGASNAGIAAQLVVSDRTVDAHLRAVFHKLGLEPDSVVNRRVRAARVWLEEGSRGSR